MTTFNISGGGGTSYTIQQGENTALATQRATEAALSAAAAEAAEDQAALHALTAQTAGPPYADTTAGLAASSEGDFFTVVGASNYAFVDLYRKVSGVAVFQRSLPSLDGMPHFPELHGAAGDGTTDDTDAFLAMIAAAGPGGQMRAMPGKTYLIASELVPLARQVFEGFEFKIAAQSVTSLTAAMTDTTSASVVLQVADASNFRVGGYVTLTKASPSVSDIANEVHTDRNVHNILAKTATTITVGTTFGLTFAIGDEVIETGHLFRNSAAGVVWRDIKINGNRAARQNKGTRWENDTLIRTTGAGCTLDNIEMINVAGEGIQLGGLGSVATNIRGDNFGGNPIHLSGGSDITVSNFHFTNCNRIWFETDEASRGYDVNGQPITPGTVGHEDGGIAWSLDCNGAKVGPGTVDGALSVFSPPQSSTADEATCLGVTGRNCKTPFKMRTNTGFARSVNISHCKFFDCGTGYIGRTSSSAETATQVRTILAENEFFNTSLYLSYAYDVRITGGFIYHEDGEAPAGRGVIHVANSKRVRIETTVNGAVFGIYVTGASEWVDMGGSHILRFTARAVDTSSCNANMKGNRMIGGALEATSGYATTSSYGVVANGGDEFSSIEADWSAISGGGNIFYTSANGARFRSNVCRIGTGVRAVRADGGTAGVIVTGNIVNEFAGTWELSSSLSNGGGGSNTFADNYALVA